MKRELLQQGETLRHPAMRDMAGIGYIIVPNNMDYYEYVNDCLRNSMITIITDSDEIIKNVLVSKNIWQDIDFPKKKNERGSAVAWLNIPKKNKPIIVTVLNKSDNLNKNNNLNSFQLTRQNISSSCTINGDGDEGIIDILVEGDSQISSKINFKITNENELGEFNVYVQGDILFESENNFEIKIKNKLNIQIIDEVDETKQTNISYELRRGFVYIDEFNNKININEKGVEIIDKNNNRITSNENGIEAVVEDNKLSVKKDAAGILFKQRLIKIDESGITIEAMDSDININSGDNVIQMTNGGINIDSGDKSVYLNGSKEVLYSLIPGLTTISDVSQIGVAKKVKVG